MVKKVETKIYCDFCGVEMDNTNNSNTNNTTNPDIYFGKLEGYAKTYEDICDNCNTKLKAFLKELNITTEE